MNNSTNNQSDFSEQQKNTIHNSSLTERMTEANSKPPLQQTPNKNPLKDILLGTIIGILLGGIVFGGFYIYKQNEFAKKSYKSEQNTSQNKEEPQTLTDTTDNLSDDDLSIITKQNILDKQITTLSDYTKSTDNQFTTKNYTKSLNNQELVISWLNGAEKLTEFETTEFLANINQQNQTNIKNRKIICEKANQQEIKYKDSISPEIPVIPDYCDLYIYKAGKIIAPIERDLYYVFSSLHEVGEFWTVHIAFYEPTLNNFITVTKPTDTFYAYNDFEKTYFDGFVTTEALNEIEPQKYISIPNQNSILKFEKFLESPKHTSPFNQNISAPKNLGGIMDVKNNIIEKKYGTNKIVFNDEMAGPVYFIDKSYRVFLANGTVAEYDLIPYFLKPNEDVSIDAEKDFYTLGNYVDINFNDPKHSTEKYELSGNISISGCSAGIVPCTNIVTNEPWFKNVKRIEVGKTQTGEPIFELANKNTNSYYKDLFNYGYYGILNFSNYKTEEDKLTENEKWNNFLNDQPLFFWQDYKGEWRVYKKHKYKSSAECGKPVIYLYPEQETQVNVQVKPTGGFTITEPNYTQNGWNVLAKPNGTLLNLDPTDNKTYSYLFWEGHSYNYTQPTQGFVMSKNEVDTKVSMLLQKLGLNQKETNDFMEFWSPKLKSSEYVFVTFVPQSEFDKMAPLTVLPKPNTTIRVFMDYKPLDKPIQITEPKIKTPTRNGFTVVEWGGVLHR